jgi:predicted oxidoreductase
MIDLIHHVMQRGVTLLDNADMYGTFTNEVIVGKMNHLGVSHGLNYSDG